MEINKNELKIANLFRKDIFLKLSIREISNKIKSKSYQRVHEAVKKLIEKNILSEERIGNICLVRLNLSREAFILLSFLDESESLTLPNYLNLMDIKEISEHLVLVTGSYASGKFTKKSDMDLVVIVPNKEDIVSIQKIIENKTMLFTPEIHLYVFKNKDFLEMLYEKKENYGKEIVRNKLILKNAQKYYELIKEAIENGYSG